MVLIHGKTNTNLPMCERAYHLSKLHLNPKTSISQYNTIFMAWCKKWENSICKDNIYLDKYTCINSKSLPFCVFFFSLPLHCFFLKDHSWKLEGTSIHGTSIKFEADMLTYLFFNCLQLLKLSISFNCSSSVFKESNCLNIPQIGRCIIFLNESLVSTYPAHAHILIFSFLQKRPGDPICSISRLPMMDTNKPASQHFST